ncbi:DoxX family protein [Streptomyces sp. NPDC001537]
MQVGLLGLRVFFGLVLASHGAQKLFGWFGGDGAEGTAAAFETMGFQPGRPFAVIAGLTEMGGGLLLAAGLAFPLATAMVIGVMINAVNASWGSGFYEGTETPMLFAAVAGALAFTGPGRYALDAGRPWQRTGTRWALGSVGLGVGTALMSLLIKV